MRKRLCALFLCCLAVVATAQAATIHDAASKGNTANISALLKADPSTVNALDKDGATPLHYAVASNHIATTKLLIGKGADVNAKKTNGVTPLHIAASAGNQEIVEVLVGAEADINAADRIERTPLSIAMEKSHLELVGFLLAHNAVAGRPSTTQLPFESLIFPKSRPLSKTLVHINLLDAPMDIKLALTVLQGLVNREQPRIYITQHPGWHTPDLIPKWMNGLKEKGFSFADVSDPLSLFAVFRRNIKGAVLYESDVEKNPAALHKLNALTLYCSLYDAVPLTDKLNRRLQLPVLLDARGKLNNAGEAYEWAYKELWPWANHNLLAFTCPSHIVLRDYLVENQVMPFWISQEMDSDAERICLRFLDEAVPNSPVMGCWGGYGEKPGGRINEPTLQQWSSEHGKFVVVSDGCFNLSVHSGLKFRGVHKMWPRKYPVYDRSKVYLCLNFTDGDNLQYIQQVFCNASWWGNPDRGRAPVAWSINPSAADLIPDMLEYLSSTCTPNDELICSTAGIGIVCPSLYAKRCTDREGVYERYLQRTSEAMKQAGLSVIHLGDTSLIPWTQKDFDYWAGKLPNLTGILGDYGLIPGVNESNAVFATKNGIPVVRVLNSPSGSPSAEALANAIRAATPKHRPAFMHVSLICWFNTPSIVVDALSRLGSEYVPVIPSDLFYLITMPESDTLDYNFADNPGGWGIAFDIKELAVSAGVLTVTTTGPDPYLIRGKTKVQASDVKRVRVRLKVGAGGGPGQFFFITDSSPVWDETKSVRFDLAADGDWHEYVLAVAENPGWKGIITGIRLDPTCLKADIPVAVDFIRGE